MLGVGIDFLMRKVRRYEHKVARAGFIDKFHTFAPAESGAALNDVEHRLQVAMMVHARLGIWMDFHRASPDLGCACARVVDGGGSRHPRSLWRVGIQFVGPYDFDRAHAHKASASFASAAAFRLPSSSAIARHSSASSRN